jgi:hypothetical protein
VLKVTSRAAEPRAIHVSDRDGKQMAALDLSQTDIAEVILLLGDSDSRRTVRVSLLSQDPTAIRGAQLVDQLDRILSERDAPRWLFSAPILHKLRLWGSAHSVGIQTREVDIEDIIARHTTVSTILGLPIRGLHPWYFGIHDRGAGLDRVANGAPKRLNPMDRPDGPLEAVGSSDEVARVEAILKSGRMGGNLEGLLSSVVDDETSPPWRQAEKVELVPESAEVKQFAQVPRLGTIQLAALDPGIARFLGFSSRVDDLPDFEAKSGWDTLAVVGLFALNPKEFDLRDQSLIRVLREVDPREGRLIQIISEAISVEAGGANVQKELEAVIADAKKKGLLVRALVTLVAPTPPSLPPSLHKPQLIQHRWQMGRSGSPSSHYRASFAFPRPPLASMSAMAFQIEGKWISRHRTQEIGSFEPPRRANPRFFGHEQEPNSRGRELGLSGEIEYAGLLADQDIPAEPGSIQYRFRASDFFGRFGAPADLVVEPPPRPAPPPPVLRFYIERASIDFSSIAALSPGKLKITFAVPRALPAKPFTESEQERLASAILVPSIDNNAAGSRRVTSAIIELDDQSQTIDVTLLGLIETEFSLPALLPQEQRTLTLSAIFKDSDGLSSSAATLPVQLLDARPPKAYETGIGLFWSSAPGPSPEVEVKLTWPAPAKSLHRVYLTDQQGLGLSRKDFAEPAPSRGRIAQVGCEKVMKNGNSVRRSGFRLLTDPPIQATTDGRAVLQTTLPRSLSTVQFLRVVPMSAEGAEAPFDSCCIVPIAVPEDRRPASPRLNGAVDPLGAAQLQVVLTDKSTLERDEPGLFNAGAKGNKPPQYRIRRAVGPVSDPIYARPVHTGVLSRDSESPEGAGFSATIVDNNAGRGLVPFVQYVYWAEVRLPPERRLPAGVSPIVTSILPVDPANAADHPRPMSLPSAPRVLMHVPAESPTAPVLEAVSTDRSAVRGDGTIDAAIRIAGAPRAHKKAVGPYRLAVWFQWLGNAIEAVAKGNGKELNGSWPQINTGEDGIGTVTVSIPTVAGVDPNSALTLRLAIVDPLGRLSPLTTPITVP